MSVTDENHPGAIGRSWKQPLYSPCIRRDSRTTLQPLKSVGRPPGKAWVAEERCGQESVVSVLNENPGDAQVGDGDDFARITTVSGYASDGMWGRDNLMADNVCAPAACDDDQCARQSFELEPGGASQWRWA